MSGEITYPTPKLPAIAAERLDMYIAQLAVSGLKRMSAIKAGIEPGSLWRYRDKQDSGELKERELEAMQFYAEIIEQTIHQRAIEGVEKGVYYEGEQVATEKVFSDRLLILLARRHIPEYREHTVSDVNVKAGVLLIQAPIASAEEWAAAYAKGTGHAEAELGRGDEVPGQRENPDLGTEPPH